MDLFLKLISFTQIDSFGTIWSKYTLRLVSHHGRINRVLVPNY